MKLAQKKFVILLECAIALFLFGCSATKYQSAEGSFAGGYRDFKIAPAMYRISFEGNAYISGEKAYQYTLYRASEVTKENNCEWFEIIEGNETLRTEYAGFLGYVQKPRSAIVIRVIKDNPSQNAYFADDIIRSLGEK